MTDKGWIKLHRQLQDCWIWNNGECFSKGQAWIDILLSCNHSDKKTSFNGKPVIIERGQWLTSILKLSEKWGWSRHKVSDFLNTLASEEMIVMDKDTKRTLISVVNYSIFQDLEIESGQQKDNKRTTKGQQKDINNNVKNDKELNNNIYNVHFEEFWKNYPRKEGKGEAYKKYLARCKCGWTEEELLTACINYANDCKKTKREKQYIKHPKTFLSDSEPFVDYLKKGASSGAGVSRLSSTNEISDAESRAIYENDECPF